MTLAGKIQQRVNNLPIESTFGYADLHLAKEEYQSAAKVLERLQKKGTIKKISKGVFYKPRHTVFGELRPNDEELLRPYLFENGKRVAYITGVSLYNQMRLTTQMAFRIKIASHTKRIYVNTGAIKATPVKSYAPVTDDNYTLLGLLDALKDLKTIPDSDTKTSVAILSGYINDLPEKKLKDLAAYALRYPPRVRALLGAILEQLAKEEHIKALRKSINPLSKFKLGIKSGALKTAPNWNIV